MLESLGCVSNVCILLESCATCFDLICFEVLFSKNTEIHSIKISTISKKLSKEQPIKRPSCPPFILNKHI